MVALILWNKGNHAYSAAKMDFPFCKVRNTPGTRTPHVLCIVYVMCILCVAVFALWFVCCVEPNFFFFFFSCGVVWFCGLFLGGYFVIVRVFVFVFGFVCVC